MSNAKGQRDLVQKVISVMRSAGRPMKASELAAMGLNRMAVKRLSDAGTIERVGYSVYSLPDPEADPRAAWAAICLRNPRAVICMESAAAYHGLTQNMAASLHVAVPLNTRIPAGESVRVVGMRWPDPMLETGVEEVEIGGVSVKVTSPERTLVDMFRYSTYSGSKRETPFAVDPETLQDVIVRYASREVPGSGIRLRDLALRMGCWDRLRPLLEMSVAMDHSPGRIQAI